MNCLTWHLLYVQTCFIHLTIWSVVPKAPSSIHDYTAKNKTRFISLREPGVRENDMTSINTRQKVINENQNLEQE